jgi:type IV pilus assembly protein PilC
MKFLFKAKNEEGLLKEGVIEALDRTAATMILQKNNLIPISLREESQVSGLVKEFNRIWEGVGVKDQVNFFRQLSVLIEAKVPITSSLVTIAEETDNAYFRIVLKEIKDDIDDGMALSEAFGKFPLVFTPLVVNLIRAGEISGSLQKTIAFIADNLERNYHLASKIKSALTYPIFVLSTAGIIGLLVSTFILPRLTIMLKDYQVSLPWYTKLIMGFSDFMEQYWLWVFIAIVGAIGAIIYYLKTDEGGKWWDEALLKIPVVGKVAQYVYTARMAENLSVLLNSGIPVVKALTLTSSIVSNSVFERVLLAAAEEVKTGGNISNVFLESPLVPRIVAQMFRIGEESGTLVQVLKSISDFYIAEVDVMTKNLTALLEPLLIVLLGIGVGIMVVGILLPIYNIAGQI